MVRIKRIPCCSISYMLLTYNFFAMTYYQAFYYTTYVWCALSTYCIFYTSCIFKYVQFVDTDWISIIIKDIALNHVLRHVWFIIKSYIRLPHIKSYFVNMYSFNDALLSIVYKPLQLQLSLSTIICAGNLCIKYFSWLIFLHVIFHMIMLTNISLRMRKYRWERRERETIFLNWMIFCKKN